MKTMILMTGAVISARGKRRGRARRITPAPVFAITSGKGGVEKTNVVANLATALIDMNKRVMVIDADLGLGNVELFLGVKPTYRLADFFTGTVSLGEIVVSNPRGVLLLPGGSGVQEITPLRHEQKIPFLTELDALTHDLDFVLVDTGSGISDAVTYFTTSAREIVVVVTPEPASMTDAYALVKVLASRHRAKRFWMLANNVAGEGEACRLSDALSGTALRFHKFMGWIPRDPHLLRAVARSRTVVAEAPDSPSSVAFQRLTDRLIQTVSHGTKAKSSAQVFSRRMNEGGRGEQ